MYDELCATYESASTRRFEFGRVDSIRASHPEALEWAKTMVNDNVDCETKETKSDQTSHKDVKTNRRNLFMSAIAKQTKVIH